MMGLDLVGRVANIPLSPSNALLPLYEAVANSIQATEEPPRHDSPRIDISIERDETQQVLNTDAESHLPIKSIEIADNGVGFIDTNFAAFGTSDTTSRRMKGGKGVGRLTWLKAFESVEVQSSYNSDGHNKLRRFRFLLPDGVVDHVLEKSDSPQSTRVRLVDYKAQFQSSAPSTIEAIGLRLIEHFLPYFLENRIPKITLNDSNESLCLDDMYHEKIKPHSVVDFFQVKNEQFQLRHVKLYSNSFRPHKAYWCAYGREVTSEALTKRITHLKGFLHDEAGKPFIYLGYVGGSFLDTVVNLERTRFDIPEDLPLEFPDQISMDDIRTRES
jgi:hypothetical protein